MPPRWVDMKVGRQTMEGYLTQPEAEGRHPAVVVIQEVWGVNSHIQSVTDRLPSRGYVGLAPAMFHREGRMTLGLHEEMNTAIARMGHCTDPNIVADVTAAVDYLKAQPFVRADRIGIVGFCFGGRVAYLAACNILDLKASVVYYGGRILQPLGSEGTSPLAQTAKITAPVLGLFGQEDANPTPADVEKIEAELKRHGKTHEFHMYPGCGHGFHCDARASYRAEAARDAWGKTIAWFDKHLKA
ncbi:MAG: dienelactone hydrolase family protein [Chloroflexota bacterium]